MGQRQSIFKNTLALHFGQFASPSPRRRQTLLTCADSHTHTRCELPGHRKDHCNMIQCRPLRGDNKTGTKCTLWFKFIILAIPQYQIEINEAPQALTCDCSKLWSGNSHEVLAWPPSCVIGHVCRGFRLRWGDFLFLAFLLKRHFCHRGNFPLQDVLQTPITYSTPWKHKGCAPAGHRDERKDERQMLGPQRTDRRHQNYFAIFWKKIFVIFSDE